MKKLGEILIQRQLITPGQLRHALRHQKSVSGSLGTCLLEAGAVTEEALLEALAEQFSVPAAGIEDLREIPESIFSLLPAPLARRCHAVAFRAMGNTLDVAVINPRDLSCQDEIAFATSKRVRLHVASEARIVEALDRYYEKEAPSRLATLLDQLNRVRYLWREKGERNEVRLGPQRVATPEPPAALYVPAAPVSAPAPEPPRVPAAAPAAGSSPGTAVPAVSPPPSAIQLTAEERRKLYPGAPVSFEDTEERLAVAEEREEVGRILLDFFSSQFSRAALFIVHRNGVEGWMARGDGLDPERFRKFTTPLDRPSVFLNLSAGSPFFLGALPPMPAHQELVECWGGEMPKQALVLPVRLHDRLVTVLYGDRIGEALVGLDLERYQRLSERVASAFERCIMLKKRSMR